MKALLDTNVILDILLKREPYYTISSKIFLLSGEKDIYLFITSSIFTDLYYIISRILSRKKAKSFLVNLLKIVDVCGVDKGAIIDAINSDFKDLEDAVQHFAAKAKNIDLIITRNKNDFKHSEIKVLTPSEFIRTY